jgi:hypothetical protein
MQKISNLTKFVALFIGTIALVLIWVTSVNAQAQLTERSKLAVNGIGPIRVGMTVDEASQSAGVKFVKIGSPSEEYCTYFKPQGEPKGIDFMVTKRRIARVDISNKQVTTIKGAKIGDTQERIFALYPGQIQATKHPYPRPPVNKKYLIFVPKDTADKNYRIIFDMLDDRVINFRSGKLPEVEYIEGCA